MKKFFIQILACLALLSIVSSCDFDANKQEYESMIGMYGGDMSMSLYTPDLSIEQSNREQVGNADGMLCTSTLKGSIGIDFDNALSESLFLVNDHYFEVQLPFLDENDNVREIFREGKLAHLYEGLQRAAADGYVSAEKMAQFIEKVRVIRDEITINFLSLEPFSTMELGNVLTSYDWEQNSFYTPFTIDPTNFARLSNLAEALQLIRPELEMLNEKGLIDPESLQTLHAIAEQIVGGVISDGSGYLTTSLANDRFEMDLHLEQATGLLDVLSTALYGKDANGKPNHELWIVLRFIGDWEDILEISVTD